MKPTNLNSFIKNENPNLKSTHFSLSLTAIISKILNTNKIVLSANEFKIIKKL